MENKIITNCATCLGHRCKTKSVYKTFADGSEGEILIRTKKEPCCECGGSGRYDKFALKDLRYIFTGAQAD